MEPAERVYLSKVLLQNNIRKVSQMGQGDRSESISAGNRLSLLMKAQALAFLIYGLAFLIIPRFTLETVFGFDVLPPLVWARIIGGLFCSIAYAEYLTVKQLTQRMDLVWVFAVVPGSILIAMLWERLFGTFYETDFFFWSSLAVAGFFFLAVIVARSQIRIK